MRHVPRPYRRWLGRSERPTALRLLRAWPSLADYQITRTPLFLIDRRRGPCAEGRTGGAALGVWGLQAPCRGAP